MPIGIHQRAVFLHGQHIPLGVVGVCLGIVLGVGHLCPIDGNGDASERLLPRRFTFVIKLGGSACAMSETTSYKNKTLKIMSIGICWSTIFIDVNTLSCAPRIYDYMIDRMTLIECHPWISFLKSVLM